MSPDPSLIDDPKICVALVERVGFLFAKLHNRWVNESVSVLREAGLGLSGVHFGALLVVESAGPMSQQMLGEQLKKDRTSVVAIVDDLEREGLVERHRNPVDRRAYALQMTEKGHHWLARARPLLTSAEDTMLSELDLTERAVLLGLLQRVFFSSPPASPRLGVGDHPPDHKLRR